MIKIAKKKGCVFCGDAITMTIKAPLATPVPCCDKHQGRAFVMGTQAVTKNHCYLDAMSTPGGKAELQYAIPTRQVGIQAATDTWVAKQWDEQQVLEAHKRKLAAYQALKAELAEVQRQQAETEGQERRQRDEAAVEAAYQLLPAGVREVAIADMKRRGQEQLRQLGVMNRIRDRRRVRPDG